jgi:opacity protein-like surface antigen
MLARLAAALVVAALAASSAWAQAYLGLSIGQAKYRDACAGAASSVTCSSDDTSLRVFGGYRFTPYFSVEAGASSLGTVRASSGESADLEAIDLSMIGTWPLANRFALYGRLGLFLGDMSASGSGPVPAAPGPLTPPPQVGWVSHNTTGATYGVGASFEMTPHAVLRLEWQRFDYFGGGSAYSYATPTIVADVLSIGALLRF